MTAQITKKNLYDQDFYLWIKITANQLKNKQFEQLDLENLTEEIEALGRNEKHEIKNNLRILLIHLLKWQYQTSQKTNTWLYNIADRQLRLQDLLEDSPSLKGYLREVFQESYQEARKDTADETGLTLETFPIDCPFSQESVMDMDYLPD